MKIIFSDESSVQNSPSSPNSWIFRTPHEAWQKDLVNIQSHVKAPISIMVWAAIHKGGRSDLIIMERDPAAPRNGYSANSYIKALIDGLLPIHFGDREFQQDNAPIHKKASIDEWFACHGIEVIDWPPHSPDLNPIEHVWKALKAELKKLDTNLHELPKNEVSIEWMKRQLITAWNALPQGLIDNLIDSLPRRLDAVIKAKGWYTKY